MKIIPSYWLLHRMIKRVTGQGPCRLDSGRSRCHIRQGYDFSFQLKVRDGLVGKFKPKKNYTLDRQSLVDPPRCTDGKLRIRREDRKTILTAIARSGKVRLTEEQLLCILKRGSVRLDGTTVLFRKHGSGEVVAVGTIVGDGPKFLSPDWRIIPRKAAKV